MVVLVLLIALLVVVSVVLLLVALLAVVVVPYLLSDISLGAPPASNSHHQDYHNFGRGSLSTITFHC